MGQLHLRLPTPDVSMDRSMTSPRRHLRLRLRLMVLLSVALAVAGSLSAVQALHDANRPSQKASPHHKHSQPLAVQQTAPVHWAGTSGPHIFSSPTETAEATNWTGHIFRGPTFTAVSGQWVVPTVQPSATGAYSGTWLGVDGVNNTSLIQAGTAQDTANGTTTYVDWYEVLPSNETLIASVSPGDHIQASITEASPGTWTIAITDSTSGQGFSQAFAYSGPGTSAEWVEESPKVNGQQPVLANFGTVRFTNMGWSGSNPSSLTDITLNMADSRGNVVASSGAMPAIHSRLFIAKLNANCGDGMCRHRESAPQS
jgi:Peptidase A4 family